MSTSGIPSSIKLTADRTEIKADGFDLSYIDVEIVDDKGIRNPTIEQLVNFDIQGPGEIIAVASSNPMTRESYQKPFRYTYNGRCLAIVKSTKERGQITLKAVSDELPEAAVIIHSVN